MGVKTPDEFLKQWALDAVEFNGGINSRAWTRMELEGLAKYIATPLDKSGITSTSGAVLGKRVDWNLAAEVRKVLEWAGWRERVSARWLGQFDSLEEVFHAAKADGREKRAAVYRQADTHKPHNPGTP